MKVNYIEYHQIEPSCAICVHSKEIFGVDSLICARKGVVAKDFVCRKFVMNSLAINTREKRKFKSIGTEADYSI